MAGEMCIRDRYYSASWTAPAQSARGSFDLTFTVNTDKYQLNTLEKVDGAVITVTPSRTGGSVDGGSWQMTPAGAQTITTSGHTQDDSFHVNGGDGSATWTVHYEVSKTSTSTLSGQEGPFTSQAEADAAAETAKNAAIGQLQNEAQGMVDAAIASARAQLANITFSYDEITIPHGFDSTPGALGSHQTITVPANSSNDYPMKNDEWSVKVSIDKIDSETKQRIKGDAEFEIFEWDTVRQCYIPFGGYNRYKVERQADGTYKVINHSNYANGSDNIYYTQRNEGKFVIVESRAPSGYYGDWTDVNIPGTASSVLGKRAYAFEITKSLDAQTIWLGNADYNADISTTNRGGTLIAVSYTHLDVYKRQLLTLAAIAKEIQQRGLPPECSVRIAAGLPLTSFGRDKPKFKDYLLRSNQPVNYKFEGVEYSITIEEVAIFPQGYAALMTETGLLQDEPSMLLFNVFYRSYFCFFYYN